MADSAVLTVEQGRPASAHCAGDPFSICPRIGGMHSLGSSSEETEAQVAEVLPLRSGSAVI